MKVALELQPCCGQRSGIGLYTYELARRLKNRDELEFQGNIFNFSGRSNNLDALADITIPISENRKFPYGLYRRIWSFIPISYGALFQTAELNLFFNYIVPPRVSGKVVTTMCDMTYIRFPETMNEKNLRRIQKDIAYSVERSDRLLTISEFSKREMMELLDVSEKNISVVPCAPSLAETSADFSLTAAKFGIRRPYILCVSTIEPRKNLERLLWAFDQLKASNNFPHQLILSGGRGWKSEKIYETAQTLACKEDVVFTGYISPGEKNVLYQNAAVFIFPSLYEGFGIPPLEAMHFGCPVVCSNAASLPEVVEDAAELVDPLEVESITAGLERVLTDDGYAQDLVQKGHEQRKKYTWESSAEKLTTICWDVLTKSS